jgi:SAM-dependent methyltransferase
MLRSVIKQVLAAAGIDSHAFLTGVRERSALRILDRKLALLDPATRHLVTAEDERDHLADLPLDDRGLEYVVHSFTVDRIRFLRAIQGTGDPVVDVGDSNGIFLRALRRDGISVNISAAATAKVHARGMDAVQADISSLPFRDGSIPCILLFETLEHLPDPIHALNEIGRVCSGSLVLSIPSVQRTTIHPFHYDPGRPIYQHHIFEFSREDFHSVITHSPFTIEREQIAVVLGEGGGPVERLIFWLWKRCAEPDTFAGCFTAFYLCHLKKNGSYPR